MGNDILNVIKAVAPVIATALGSPLAGAAVSFLVGKLGLSENTVEAVSNAVAGMSGADLVKMKELDLEFQKFMAENGIKLDLAQIGVNLEDAKSEKWWQYGWRPFVGWVGGIGFAYAAIVEPAARFVAVVCFHYTGSFPAIDTMLTMQVLFGLLGLAGMRSYEKTKGTK